MLLFSRGDKVGEFFTLGTGLCLGDTPSCCAGEVACPGAPAQGAGVLPVPGDLEVPQFCLVGNGVTESVFVGGGGAGNWVLN